MTTISEYAESFSNLDASYSSAEVSIAHSILHMLKGYRGNTTWRDWDANELAKMLEAYAGMIQRSGVKVNLMDALQRSIDDEEPARQAFLKSEGLNKCTDGGKHFWKVSGVPGRRTCVICGTQIVK
jgi:hypothetical protein